MATASRSRAPAAAKRPRVPLAALAAADAARSWGVPVLALAVIALLTALSAAGAVGTAAALAGTVAAALVLLLYIGERPLVTQARSPRERGLGAGLALVWFVACYGPFHARLFPGTPLHDGAQVTAAGRGLPLRIPPTGRSAVDLLLEGQLPESPNGNAAPPVNYSLTLEGAGGTRVGKGTVQDSLGTRRPRRRGSATVHQRHTADVRMLSNP